jgi:uncharacterized membrane protein
MATHFTPLIAVHTMAAITALIIGPWAIWARRGAVVRPELHRMLGRAWVALMVFTALTALGIRHSPLAVWQGMSWIHLLVPVTLIGLFLAVRAAMRRRIAQHQRAMQQIYIAALVIPGLFTLLPSRVLGQLVWGQWLGWL